MKRGARWPAPPRSKYHAKRTTIDGHRFASLREGNRYGELRLMERAGKIRGLTLQPRFVLLAPVIASGTHRKVAEYVGDFWYEEAYPDGSWRPVVEDAKGVRTAVYRLKCRWVEAQLGIRIREV